MLELHSINLLYEMSAKELEGVTGNVKQAREQALVGNYDDSKVYYVGAIQGVKKVIKQTHDPETKQKWQEVCIVYLYSYQFKSICGLFLNSEDMGTGYIV